MLIEKIPITKLNPAKYNPRKDLKPTDEEYQKLKRSIKEFGYIEPIVWNKTTGNVISGHQRLKILIEQGAKDVDVVVVELDDLKEKACNIAMNKIGGEWEFTKLSELLDEINLSELDIEITGFNVGDIEDMEEITQDNETKDLSEAIKDIFEVIISCENESHTKSVYEKLIKEGYKCRVLIS